LITLPSLLAKPVPFLLSNVKMVIQLTIVKIQLFECRGEFSEGVMVNSWYQHLFGEGSAQYLMQFRDHWTMKYVQDDRAMILDNARSVIKPDWNRSRVSDSPSSSNWFLWGSHGAGIENMLEFLF